ncbi:MAG: radical SAM protein [Clostridia bacterium]|nr:radical SAM protein [Clostridia bacterium]
MKKRHYNIPVFVPHIGCPHDCVFCNQRHITGTQSEVCADDVRRIIDEHLKYIDKNGAEVEVAFFGGSFTGIDFNLQTSLMREAYEYIKAGRVDSLRCSTRPDCIDGVILENAKKYGMKTIELGVQSTDSEVLLKSGRGHGREEVFAASELIKKHGFSLGLQMMLGLPADTREKSIRTAKDIISISPDFVRIYPTLVVEDTALYDMYKSDAYKPITTEYAVDLAAELIEMFEDAGIEVIRIGLQTTDNINEETVIGPYHSAMGELARAEVYKRSIEKRVTTDVIDGVLIYTVPEGETSKAVGHKRSNIKYFKDKYGIDLKIVETVEKN